MLPHLHSSPRATLPTELDVRKDKLLYTGSNEVCNLKKKEMGMELKDACVDQRLKRNTAVLFSRMVERKVVSLRKLANNRAETVKFERLLGNKAVSPGRLINAEQARIRDIVAGRHILAVQDTTEINYQKHAGRVKQGLGRVGNGIDLGFFLHPMLVLDAKTGSCLGSSEIHIENRLEGGSKNYQQLPIEEKESYRWITTAAKSKEVLSKASCITFIGDRENDIYEFFDRIPDERTHSITRVRGDRCLVENKKLYTHLESQPEAGRMRINIPSEKRKGRQEREALLAIRYSKVTIQRPLKCTDKKAKQAICLNVVEVKELDCPTGQEPIEWRLLTTHEVNELDEAKHIILWYRQRWNVEQIFRTMKKQGFDIESSQLESPEGLMKLAVMALCAATRVLALVLAREGKTEQRTHDVFTQEEQVILAALLVTLEGKTVRQKNPYAKENLAWASWIIARLGGWKGAQRSEGLPGPITMSRGLRRFSEMVDGWNLCKNLWVE